ncbi:MAG: DUF418 domain-containing protein [Beutenbergiaceae bacterium]
MTHTSLSTRSAGRSLAPDLARGLMLLLIALANVPAFLAGNRSAMGFSHPEGMQGADLVWQIFSIITIDARSYPLFAFLFGYGIWQSYRRQAAAGTAQREATRLLQRRHLWMIFIGAVHATLLWHGDVVGAYGLLGLLLVWLFLDRADTTLRIWCIVLIAFLAVSAVMALVSAAALSFAPMALPELPSDLLPNPNLTPLYLLSMGDRMVLWFLATLGAPLMMTLPAAMLLGVLAARHRLLDDPGQHRRLLSQVAVVGIATGWLGGLLSAAVFAGWAPMGIDLAWAIPSWHQFTGLAGGIGYAAAFGLLAHRIQQRGIGPIARAVQSVGKRSLSNYLGQSIVFAPLLSAWGLGLGAVLSPWQAALLALATWLVLLVISAILESRGVRGPAEWLLRKLAYRHRPVAPPAPVGTGGLTDANPTTLPG